MVTTEQLITAEEFALMPPSANRRELVRGKIVEMAPVSGDHAYVAGKITELLVPFNLRQRIGSFFVGEPGFRLGTDPDTVRAADIAFFVNERVALARQRGFPTAAPDFVVEVCLPLTRRLT